MNPIKKLAGQTAIYGLSSIVGRLLNYLLVPFYTRIFTTGEYGVVTEIYAYVSFLVVVLTYGMETAYFRFSEKVEDKEKLYSTSLISLLSTSAIFILITSIFSTGIANWMGYALHPEYIIWFVLIVAFDAITAIPFAKLRAQNKALKFATIKLVNIFTNIGFNLFFILLCPYLLKNSDNTTITDFVHSIYNPAIGVGYIFIANLLSSAITVLMLFPSMVKIKFSFDTELWKKMIKYALPLLIVGLAGIINETFDRALLKHLLPDKATAMSQLGIYGACYKISILMTIFIQTFRFAADPFFFSEAKNKNAQQIYADVMKYFVIVCAFIFLGTMLYMDVVKTFVGKDFYSGLKVVPILLMANLFLGVFINLSIWYKLSGQTMYGAYLSIFGAIITLVLNYWWIPIFGYMGSAWATFICYFAMMVLSYFVGQKHYPVNYDLIRIFGSLGLYVLLFFVSEYLYVDSKPMRLTVNSIYLIGFVLVVYVSERRVTKVIIKD